MDRHLYPFTAIIGQEAMKTALLLNAVDPTIGGVLIRGHKGTGKSTAARALTGLLPEIEVVDGCPFHCPPDQPDGMHDECFKRFSNGEELPRSTRTMPMVELPLSATEDRVVGTLHIEHALRKGERRFEPGLLASANRGILYVDEVNLLDDHLVDVLLDAAASGVNIVEREGISYTHPARFMLIGTMNPEEGDLRPQFLDRFGLCVIVKGLEDVSDRKAIVRQRIAFERDPDGFLKEWSDSENTIAAQIVQARANLDAVYVPDEMLEAAVRLALQVEVQGHRAEIAIVKAARALAALVEKEEVDQADIVEASRFVLPHRMKRAPLDTPEALFDKIGEAVGKVFGEGRIAAKTEAVEDWGDETEQMQIPGSAAVGSILLSFLKKKLKKRCLTPTS
ncbi:MAG: ATP-binding protein [bacterium]